MVSPFPLAMPEPIAYGLIGFGGLAENRLAREGFALDRSRFAPLREAFLVGATDINPQRRDTVAQLGLVWYPDIEAMLADPAITAVFVATNNGNHATAAERALKAGRHVLVEKPMATTSKAASDLVRLARQCRLSLAVDHMMIENVYNRKARELVRHGTLGPVNDACFHMEFRFGSTPAEAASWRCANPAELGGPIGDVASHCLYMAEYILDSPIVSLACVYYPKTLKTAVEDGAYIRFRLENGRSGSIRVAFCDHRGTPRSMIDNLGYELYGDRGVLRSHGTLFQLSGHADEPLPLRLELDRFETRADMTVEQPVNIYQALIRRHVRSIRDNRPLDGRDGLHNLILIEACHASAQRGGLIQSIGRSP